MLLSAAWRTIDVEEYKDNQLIATYKKQIEGELEAITKDVLELLETALLPNDKGTDPEAATFYFKM